MLLAIDAGNTNVEFAVFENKHLVAQWRACSSLNKTPDEWAAWLISLMTLAGVDHTKISKSIIACVVPHLLSDLSELTSLHFGHKALVIGEDQLNLGLGSEIGNPEEAGADLLATCAAAKLIYGWPALFLDRGTATTLSLVNHHGNFAGVAIAPGLQLSLEALSNGAARLPQVGWAKIDKVIGTTTQSAIQGGVYWGYLGLVENLITKAKEQYLDEHPEAEIKVIATGGLARHVIGNTTLIDHYDPDLGLKGLQLIAELN
jgi:type III pantothenate kinase